MTSAIDFLPTISSCQAVSQINRATARWGPHAGNHQSKKDSSRHFHWPRASVRSAQKSTAQSNGSLSPQIKSLIEDIVVRVFRSQGILLEHKVLPPNK